MQRQIVAFAGIAGFLLAFIGFVALLLRPWLGSERDIPEFHFDVKGIADPDFATASEAGVQDDDLVIGVAGFDVPRAYVLKALQFVPPRHVVSTVTPQGALAVTRCERSACTRVFVDRGSARPLDVRIGGWRDKQLELIVADQRYAQNSPEIPLEQIPFVETTWRKWRAQFPSTLVYTGPTSRQDRMRIAQWERERAKLGMAPDSVW
jgi:hypothetical protein